MPFDIRDFCRNCIPRACTPYISVAAMGTVINLTLQLCRAQTAAILARFSLTERNDKFVTVKIKREREREKLLFSSVFHLCIPLLFSFFLSLSLFFPFFLFSSFFFHKFDSAKSLLPLPPCLVRGYSKAGRRAKERQSPERKLRGIGTESKLRE